jgi:arylsulfatase A-like enzyme
MSRANIIVLQCDQHRHDALGCVNPLVKTPNLDALASRGIRFEQAVCNAPMCVPSRYSMMLGLYGSQCGVRHNTGMCATDSDLPLPVLAQRLQTLGYQTAGFGKTHWYPGKQITGAIPFEPSRRGFEHRAIVGRDLWEPDAALFSDDLPKEHAAQFKKEHAEFVYGGENYEGYRGNTSIVPADWHPETWLTRKTTAFLERDRDSKRPLFLYLSFDAPHPGLNVPKEYVERYDIDDIPDMPWPERVPDEHCGPRATWWDEYHGKTTPHERRMTRLRYYAYCTFCDELFGRALEQLRHCGELDNSLIVFTADHGEMLGDRRHRFGKYCLYEASVRVPLIVAGSLADGHRRGTVDREPAELVDILPTVLAAAGERVPPELPGVDLFGARRKSGGFAEMHGGGYDPVQNAPMYMWRTPEWKLILYLPERIPDAPFRLDEIRGELYSLGTDPMELTNLYDTPEHLSTRDDMTRRLLMYLSTVWAKYPRQASRASIQQIA